MTDKPQSAITMTDESIDLTVIDNTLQNISFVDADCKTLFTIHPDGKIERGEAFTTTDEMSLEFWRLIEQLRGDTGC